MRTQAAPPRGAIADATRLAQCQRSEIDNSELDNSELECPDATSGGVFLT
jgi:hypothetical protein